MEWDSDASDSDDDTPSKSLAGIAIKAAPSLFDSPPSPSTPVCLMAKGDTKVEDDECDEFSNDDLVNIVSKLDDSLGNEKKKVKRITLELSTLQESYDKLKATHDSLQENHEKLKLEHEALISQANTKEKDVVGSTSKLFDDASTTTSSACKVELTTNDNPLRVEIHKLKNKVELLTNDLERCYKGKETLAKMLGGQRNALNKEGVGYEHKKGKKAFAPHKTRFVKSNGKYCNKCKSVGHVEKECKGNKVVSFAKFDNCYYLHRLENGNVEAKFVGTAILGAKKSAIWVPKALVTNLQGPKKVWVPKKN